MEPCKRSRSTKQNKEEDAVSFWVQTDGLGLMALPRRTLGRECSCYWITCIAQQVKGIPMGNRPRPHFANLYCYPVEKHYALAT